MTTSTACLPQAGFARFIGTCMRAPPLPLVFEYVLLLMESTNLSKCCCVVRSTDFHAIRPPGLPFDGGRMPTTSLTWPWKVSRMRISRGDAEPDASSEASSSMASARALFERVSTIRDARVARKPGPVRKTSKL
eukprot:CAMPEP_0206166696 /NCGR_PEP_ID=MMETSP1474-20131121/25061_1 /ASSEMBLY_ACC=CAM_ASM_001110 /TAXON_ID=97495 /ORGANISM="Imantonia sp., Strain RCC918" /LENGTH=133 /DNA_ID=CAMNT_0053570877 /DNA_START=472 /DNA_END=869 /DNA_ORIENTATION=-